MELTKAQRALVAMPSRWPQIMLGITLSLFISAIFTSNFAIQTMPDSISSSESSPLASSSIWAPSPASISSFSSRLFILLFRSSYTNAAPHEHYSSSPLVGMSPKAHAPTWGADTGPSSDEITGERNKESGGSDEASKDSEIVKYNNSLPSEEASPSTKPLGAGSLLGHKVYTHDTPLSNITYPLNGTYPLNATFPLNATSPLSDTVRVNESISSSEQPHDSVPKASLPDSSTTIEPSHNRLPVSPLSDKESRIPFNRVDMVGRTDDTDPLSKPMVGDTDVKLPLSPQQSLNGKSCDISIGQWVEDQSYPLYSPGTCPFVDEAFSCQRNGRPDSKYNGWRWAPRDCNVPRFNGTDLLERLRGKRLVFVGDSLNRNQWESMLCLLRESLKDKRRIVQIHGGRISKLPGVYAFKFLDYDCKVEFYTSQYLVDKQEGIDQTQFTIRLDRMDKSERRWRKANVLVFNTGHWWTPDKIGDGNNRFQEGSVVHKKFDVSVAYNKALSTWAKWVDTYVNLQNTSVFFRGYSPVHYIGGQWNSGGQCQDETEPIFDESFLTPYPSKMQALEGVVRELKVPVHLLNITRLSDYRKDAHPATYGHAPHHVVEHQDCSHWCLPGLPDTWNELLYFFLSSQSTSI
eukprot:c17420_g1_i2 orf=676-2574(-)